jgi:hypothetical protein
MIDAFSRWPVNMGKLIFVIVKSGPDPYLM